MDKDCQGELPCSVALTTRFPGEGERHYSQIVSNVKGKYNSVPTLPQSHDIWSHKKPLFHKLSLSFKVCILDSFIQNIADPARPLWASLICCGWSWWWHTSNHRESPISSRDRTLPTAMSSKSDSWQYLKSCENLLTISYWQLMWLVFFCPHWFIWLWKVVGGKPAELSTYRKQIEKVVGGGELLLLCRHWCIVISAFIETSQRHTRKF